MSCIGFGIEIRDRGREREEFDFREKERGGVVRILHGRKEVGPFTVTILQVLYCATRVNTTCITLSSFFALN